MLVLYKGAASQALILACRQSDEAKKIATIVLLCSRCMGDVRLCMAAKFYPLGHMTIPQYRHTLNECTFKCSSWYDGITDNHPAYSTRR